MPRGASRRRRGPGSPGTASGSTQRAAEAIIAALSVHSSRRRDLELDAEPRDALAQARVGRHAAAEREPRARLGRQRALDADHQPLDDRVLVGGREVGGAPPRLLLPQVAHRVEQRGLQAREGEVEARDPRGGRERERRRVARLGELRQRRAARVGQPEQPRALVERLAGGVVERRARAPRRRPARSRAPAACARPRRAGTGTAARSARARGRWPRRAPAGGRRARAAAAARRPGPWPSRRRRAARRPAPAPG